MTPNLAPSLVMLTANPHVYLVISSASWNATVGLRAYQLRGRSLVHYSICFLITFNSRLYRNPTERNHVENLTEIQSITLLNSGYPKQIFPQKSQSRVLRPLYSLCLHNFISDSKKDSNLCLFDD